MRYNDWNYDLIENVTNRVKVGFVGTCEKYYCNKSEGIPMIRTTNLKEYGINYSDLKYVTKEFHERNKKSQLQKNDILVARHGENGKACLFDQDIEANCLNVIVIEPNNSIVLAKFLKYLFDTSIIKDQVSEAVVGTVQNVVNTKAIAKLKIPVPSIMEQSAIVETLSCLDDKIDMNNRINDNLADLTQSVYQERFINSENANINGHLSEICEYSKARISVSELSLGNYYSTENMLPDKGGSVNAASLPSVHQTPRCSPGDVLISNIRPYFKKIIYCHSEGGRSGDVLCFTPKAPSMSAYLFSTLYANRFFDFMVSGSKGTKMPRGDKKQIMTYPIHIPTKDEIDAFNDIANPIFSIIKLNEEENKRLTDIRNIILHKLMSGELSVGND